MVSRRFTTTAIAVCLIILVWTDKSFGTEDCVVQNETISAPIDGCGRRVCYFTEYFPTGPGNAFDPATSVDPSLCSHLIYAFASLRGNHLKITSVKSSKFKKWFKALKKINPNLKTLLAVGGWNLGSAPFTKMVSTAERRQDFADHSVDYLKSRSFDGLDLDWEYPANRGSPPEDKDRFTLLIKQLRNTYNQDAADNGGSPLLLTAAVSASRDTIDKAYDIPEISLHLDFVNLMSYDFHGSWDAVTGHHSGLLARPEETGSQRFLNTNWAARYWVKMGCPKEKLVIGIPTYARTFTLVDSAQTFPGAPASGAGTAGDYTGEQGVLSYYEVCTMVATADEQSLIIKQKVPYLVKGYQWVGYEDALSVKKKTRYTKAKGYGGVMTWALQLDDFTGTFCGKGKYPLWSAVNKVCFKNA